MTLMAMARQEAGASAQGPTALGREGSDSKAAGSEALAAPGRLAAMPTAPGEAEAAAALAAQHIAVNAYKGAHWAVSAVGSCGL